LSFFSFLSLSPSPYYSPLCPPFPSFLPSTLLLCLLLSSHHISYFHVLFYPYSCPSVLSHIRVIVHSAAGRAKLNKAEATRDVPNRINCERD
jgi:hypothetical protein